MGDRVFAGLKIPSVATLPAAGSPGKVLFLTTDGQFYGDDGFNWLYLTPPVPVVIVTLDDPYDILNITGDVFVLAESKGTQTVNLPAAESNHAKIHIKNVLGGTITVSSTDLIDDNTTVELDTAGQSVSVKSNNVTWFIF